MVLGINFLWIPRDTCTATAATGFAESEDGEVVLELVLDVVLLGLELDVELALVVLVTFCFLFIPFLGFLLLGSSSDESEVLSSSTIDILGFLLSR